MIRVHPGDHFDGVGWGKLSVKPPKVEHEYMMWRKDVYAEAQVDSGTGDNDNQRLRPRIADQMWPHNGPKAQGATKAQVPTKGK
jgi:hypothetical protein